MFQSKLQKKDIKDLNLENLQIRTALVVGRIGLVVDVVLNDLSVLLALPAESPT